MNKKQPVPCGCGGEAVTDYIIGEPCEGLDWFVYCKNCEIQLPAEYSTEDEAIDAWNKAMGAKDINVHNKERTYKVTDIHVDEYYCPACGAEIPHAHEDKGDNYCRECGARLEWDE